MNKVYKKYDKSAVMKRAWVILRSSNGDLSWSECLVQSWNVEKNGTKQITFEYVYNKFYNKILSHVKFRIKDHLTAEEITQDVFVKVSEHLNNYDVKIGALSTWIYNIAKNRIIDHYRRDKSHLKTNISDFVNDRGDEVITFIDHGSESDANMVNDQLSDNINMALSKLKPMYKKVLILCLVENKSYKEISEICGLSLSNTKISIMRGKEKLQTILQAEREMLNA